MAANYPFPDLPSTDVEQDLPFPDLPAQAAMPFPDLETQAPTAAPPAPYPMDSRPAATVNREGRAILEGDLFALGMQDAATTGAAEMVTDLGKSIILSGTHMLKYGASTIEAVNAKLQADFAPEYKGETIGPRIPGMDKIRNFEKEYLAIRPKDNWYEMIPEALGSTVPFFLAPSIAARAKMHPDTIVALMGAALGGNVQYEEALAMGATPNQAAIALGAGSLVGTSEALPMHFFLNKLEGLIPGAAKKFILKEGLQAMPKSAAISGLIGLGTEALQEGGQAIMSNFVASDIAGYDPSRSLTENVFENAATGGTVGMLLGGTMGLVHKRRVRQALDELQANFDGLAADPINQITGAFSPLGLDGEGDLLTLGNIAATLTEEITRQSAIAEALYAAEVGTIVPQTVDELMAAASGVPNEAPDITLLENLKKNKQVPRYYGEVSSSPHSAWNALKDTVADPDVEKALPPNPTGGLTRLEDALAVQPVVVSASQMFTVPIQAATHTITKLEETIRTIEAISNPTDRLRLELSQARVDLEVHKRNRLELQKRDKLAISTLKEIKNVVAQLAEVFYPGDKVVIFDTSLNLVSGSYGGFYTLSKGVMIGGKPVNVHGISFDLGRLVQELAEASSVDGLLKQKRHMLETIYHESGHGIATRTMVKIMDTIYDSTSSLEEKKAAWQLFTFIERDYSRWIKAIGTEKQAFLYQTQFAAARGMSAMGATIDPETRSIRDKLEYRWGGAPGKDYLLSFDEYFAEQTSRTMTNGKADAPELTGIFREAAATYKAIFDVFPEYAQNNYAKNWVQFLNAQTLTAKIAKMREMIAAGGGKNMFTALTGKLPGFDPKKFRGTQAYLDRFGTGLAMGINLLQLQQMNPHIEQIQRYITQGVEPWANYSRTLGLETLSALIAWRGLLKSEQSQLSNVFVKELELDRRLNPRELSAELTGEGIAVYNQVRAHLDFILAEMQVVAEQAAAEINPEDVAATTQRIADIRSEFGKMKQKGYFPAIRFGEYTISVRAKELMQYRGETFEPGKLVMFTTFESERERDKVRNLLLAELGPQATVDRGRMRETDFAVQGMPRSMLLALRDSLKNRGELTEETAHAFEQALLQVAPFKSFTKNFARKKGIFGASDDLMRAFAYYGRSAGGHIARVKYSGIMREAINDLQDTVALEQRTGGLSQTRQEIVHWMNEHYSYILNPAEEWAGLRGVGFVAYLGFMVKSAAVNALQVPFVTYPYLAARYGDAKAVQALTKANYHVVDWAKNKQEYIDALPDDKGNIKKPNEKKARHARLYIQGISESWLDQSLATELAIAASENNLDRGLHLPAGKRVWHEFSRYSAIPFHLVEKLNRFVTATAAYDLAYAETKDHNKAVLHAKQAVQRTQFENARWNRPWLLRGKKSVALLFGNYIQNMLFFAVRDPGARRWYMMMLVAGGLMGLPFMQDMEDLIDFVVTFVKGKLGMKNPKYQLRVELREALEELNANPDLILHGLSQNSFGMGHVGEMLGIPIPQLDLSGSISMGNIIPGTKIPQTLMQGKPDAALVQGAAELAGAGGNLVEQFYSGLFSSDPDTWKRMEKTVPFMAFRAASKATRYAVRGQETTADGTVVARFDPHDLRDQLEIVGQGLGFTPSRVSVGWEREIAIRDQIQYYMVRKAALQRQLNAAWFQEDRETVADVRNDIATFNSTVPFREMGMAPKDIKNSMNQYLKERRLKDYGISAERKYRRLEKSLEAVYPDPAGDRVRKDPFAQP